MAKYIPILMYHNILESVSVEAPDWISILAFKNQMTYILKKGYTPITPDLLLSKKSLPKKPILITFDDGYENIYHLAFPILKELNINFTLFVISSFISNENDRKSNSWDNGKRPLAYHLSKSMIKEMQDSKLLSIGSHSHSHQIFKDISEQEIEQEIALSVHFLKQEFDQKIYSFSYPGGYVGDKHITYSILKKSGIQLAFGGQIDRIENLKKINYFNIYRINITNDINFTSTKVKYRFDGLLNPALNKYSKYNKLNFIINKLLPPYHE
jgi:peptidoglycan/xylan/chitin deacetylase (PgdA/CDA1 family)